MNYNVLADKAEFERNRTEENLNAINAEKIVSKYLIKYLIY